MTERGEPGAAPAGLGLVAAGDARVSVVMVTHNRAADAVRSLERHAALPEAPPLTVFDNASSDGTAAAVRAAHPGVRLVELEENLGAAARNIGVAAAETPYVAFSDDDSWWAPGALARAADVLDAHPSLAAVAARILVGEAEREDPICAEMLHSPLDPVPGVPGSTVLGFLACAIVFRRSAFLELGGFRREMMIGGEEEILACDLATHGWPIAYVPELTVHHHPAYRDGHRRRRLGLRNTLWFLWLRRPARSALRRTLHLARTIPRDRVSLQGFADALAAARWVWRERRVVPPHVEEMLQRLDDPQMTSTARQYVS